MFEGCPIDYFTDTKDNAISIKDIIKGGVFLSHLHLVDGVIAPIWWVLGYVIALGILGFAVMKVKTTTMHRKVPFVGVVSALMLITMSVPLGFLPFHLNLTVLVGILAGPWLGLIAVFIVNLILAFIGHGGITVVGLNTLIIGVELIAGYLLYRTFSARVKRVTAVVVAVVIALLISTTFMFGIVIGTDAGIEHALPHHHCNHDHEDTHHDQHHAHEHHEWEQHLEEVHFLAFTGLSAVLIILLLGIALEAFVTALIVKFFMKVRPDMINSVNISSR